LPKNFVRIKNAIAPMTLEQMWAMEDERSKFTREKYGQEYSEERFNAFFKDFCYGGLEVHEKGEKNCFTI